MAPRNTTAQLCCTVPSIHILLLYKTQQDTCFHKNKVFFLIHHRKRGGGGWGVALQFCTKLNIFHIGFDIRKSVHYHMIQIIQPTRCNSFTSLLLDVYVWLNMFWASPSPSSEAYNCTRSHWFYCWREAAGALLVVVWLVGQTTTGQPDHDQQCSSRFSPTVKPEAPSAGVCSLRWAGRRLKHVEPHTNVK
jgi:hypothetical protein